MRVAPNVFVSTMSQPTLKKEACTFRMMSALLNTTSVVCGFWRWSDLGGASTRHICGIELWIRSQMRWLSCKQLLFAVKQIRGAESCQLKSMAVRERIGRASFHAISAKDAAIVVNVINLRVSLSTAHPVLGRVFRGLDINAVRRAVRRP